MKLPFALILFVFLCSCRRGTVPDIISISIDNETVNGSYEVAEFDKLIREHNGLLHELDIEVRNARNEVLYEQREIDGHTNVQRKAAGMYRFYEYWILPVSDEDFFGPVHMFTFEANLNNGIIVADTGNIPPVCVWEGRFPTIIAAYDSLEAYERAHPTGDNWENVPDQQFNYTSKIAFQLALATLNGCEPCRARFKRIRKTFDYMNAGETSEILQTFERLVWRYDQIKRQKSGPVKWVIPPIRY